MFSPIAIIGRACVLPGAQSPDELWEIIHERRCVISPAPQSRWRASRERALADGICVSDAGGFVQDLHLAAGLDPTLDLLFHWLIHVGRNALSDAGIAMETGCHRAGAIVGNLAYPTESLVDLAQSLYVPEATTKPLNPLNRFSAGFPVHLLCRTLGLTAGGYAMDAACASSLYAIKIACDWLHSDRADLMLAGAINRVDGLLIQAGFTALRALSPTGQSRPFHREADGLVPAEGAALFVLKRLADAEAAGDRIHGIIRGIGLSNDGRGSGLLTPSAAGQTRAMHAAYAQSGLNPGNISLIECHATGTSVGDAVELQSMSEVFDGLRDIPIGSLKSNLGHLITVSGAAGIIKVLEAIRHRRRPPTLNATPENQAVAGSPFRLLLEEESWEPIDGAPRRAAVSSFGFGGNNAHLLLEEYRPGLQPVAAPGTNPQRVAIVGMAARLAGGESTEEFESDLMTGDSRIRRNEDGTLGATMEQIRLPASGLIFPPRDLERALAQQNLLLETVGELIERTPALPARRTSAFIGITCDPESTRTVLRAALADLLDSSEIGTVEFSQRQVAMDGGFDAARVVGCMPNIPANRLNRQFDLGGPSFTIAAEELSGIRALELSTAALVSKEIDAALVGVSDFCVEPINQAAANELPANERTPGDGACVLLLKRIEDAVRDHDVIRAILDLTDSSEVVADHFVAERVRKCFGHVHAAAGLLEVAAALVMLERSIEFNPKGSSTPLLPGRDSRRIHLSVQALGDQRRNVCLIEASRYHTTAPSRHSPVRTPDIFSYAARDITELINEVEADRRCADGQVESTGCRLAIVCGTVDFAEKIKSARMYLEKVRKGEDQGIPPEGVFFHQEALAGELAFVFTGASAAYPDMGRDLLLALPQLAPAGSQAEWIYQDVPGFVPNDFERLCGSSFLCQVHAGFTQQVLGLQPDAAIGLSSGETNALYALGAWKDMRDLLKEIEECGLYTSVLGGRAEAVHQMWDRMGINAEHWASYWLPAPFEKVAAAVRNAPAVHVTIINSPDDVVIAGDNEACCKVIDQLGIRATRLGGDFAVHCPEVEPAAALWRSLHHRPTTPPSKIRFYSNAHGSSYPLSSDSVADALTRQALAIVDFPRTIRQAWRDGVRIFVEHGPRNQCTQSIRRILEDRPFVAVSMDVASRSALTQAIYATAELWTAGVPVDISRLRTVIGSSLDGEHKKLLLFPAHPQHPDVVMMTPAPELSPVMTVFNQEESESLVQPLAVAATALHEQMSQAHQEHLHQMMRMDQAYQEVQLRFLQALTGTGLNSQPAIQRSFSRAQLEIHASGRVSDVFGPAFKLQDDFKRQVRMPEPPLLLADRVISLTGEPGGMGLGSITTETDLPRSAWYLHQGRMPAGLTIEAGQADLMLISWLGVDKLNKGARVYRLLGCDLCFSGGLPRTGETLRYEITVESHASHGGVRIFFFHYDCTSLSKKRLTVRNGQAGFFTDEELIHSEGVLWSPETGTHTPSTKARVEPGPRVTTFRSFDCEQIRTFAEGRPNDCFGSGFECSRAHTRTPRIQDQRMQLLQTIPVFDPQGGPWKRGYLRAEWNVQPDDWFFKGHFKNDPCMPGTLMFEGCLQAMAFYLSAIGFTLDRDGWRFEPVSDQFYSLRCRGQVIPSSKLLVYELFVDEIVSGPTPTLYADVLCTVDGLKAFHCARLGLQLVPDWPLDESQPLRSANVPFDYSSLMACALGRPSNAFGSEFVRFDGSIKVPRLPAPPYHFMSRVMQVGGKAAVGATAEVEYDVPPDAWYFKENGHPVMPISVLTEVLLQPCGWLASFAGTWKDIQHDIFFRNLDGGGVVHTEIGPLAGILRTRVRLVSCSEVGPMSITAFEISCRCDEVPVFDGQAVFGHFPAEALNNQTGLPISAAEHGWLESIAPGAIDLNALHLHQIGRGKLRMIDRITGYWPTGGAAKLGRLRAELDVDPGAWFFKAHFFGDPVQPGSLGMEAVTQTLQIWTLASGRGADMKDSRFEAIAVGEPVKWTYRGQVLPHNRKVTILMEILEAAAGFAKASASLWVDGTKIYSISNIAVRLIARDAAKIEESPVEELNPERDRWLRDHCPTYTIPALPMMSIVDRLATAAHRIEPRKRVIELHDLTLNGWIAFPEGKRRLKSEAVRHHDEIEVTLSAWREAPHAALSRYDVMASAIVRMAEEYPQPVPPLSELQNAESVAIPYETGELFHGPAFHFVQKMWRSNSGSSFDLDSGKGRVPPGLLNQGLLDGITHGIPNENLRLWSDKIGSDHVGYPSRIIRFAFFQAPPLDGISRCEVRFAGFYKEDNRFPRFHAQLIADNQVWAELDLVYVLFPKGKLGTATAAQRRDFLQNRKYVAYMELGDVEETSTCLTAADFYESDWLPGTLENAFALKTRDRIGELAVKQHVARETQVHPANISVLPDGQCDSLDQFPLNCFPVLIERLSDAVRVHTGVPAPLDCRPVRNFWQKIYGVGEWPVADLHIGLVERFVRRVELVDPSAFRASYGKPAIFLANHQVAVESILFTVVVGALSGIPIKVIAKTEHRRSWIGKLIELTLRYPGVNGPKPILFFDRADPRAMLESLAEYRSGLDRTPCSLMVHVEGTRALSARTPVSQVSSVFLDLALELDLPVVPVRFIGGLPAQPVPERLEFPFGAGQQDVRIGRPILPKRLCEWSLLERSKAVLHAINSLAPIAENSSGKTPVHLPVGTTLVESLRLASNRCAASEMLLAALDGREVDWPPDSRGRWLHEFKTWLASECT